MRALHADRYRWAVFAGLLAVLAASNRWKGWSAGIRLLTADDSITYRRMALAAPSLPTAKVGNQHAEVFAYDYVVGLISYLLHVNIDYVFRAVSLALVLGICLTLHVAVTRAGLRTQTYAVCMAVFILNTYSLRYYLIASGYFLDVTFVLAVALAVNALLAERYWLALLAITLAMPARQTTLPVTLALAWWVAFAPGFAAASVRVRTMRALLIILLPVVVFVAMIVVSAPFSTSGTPGVTGLTVLGDFEHLPSTIGALAEHLARVANSLFAVGSLTIVALLARHRAEPGTKLPFAFKGPFVVGCSIAGQALLLNTNYTGHPERLTALSLEPFVVALAYLLAEAEQRGLLLSTTRAWAISAVLAAGSLQYLYTIVGPATAAQGGVLQLLAAVIVGALLWQAFGGQFAIPGRRRHRLGDTAT